MASVKRDFYLLLDASIICSYLATEWMDTFNDSPHFKGILIPVAKESPQVLEQRQQFHDQYAGCEEITPEVMEACLKVYPDIEETEEAMLQNFGVAAKSATSCANTFYIGPKANSPETRAWMESQSHDGAPAIFVCATQILRPWWIDFTESQLFNTHSAVLPYARGMYAIENMAAERDIAAFKRAAGFTIHYIDAGVDTGAMIKTQRLREPFAFDTIWSLKGHLYKWEAEQFLKFALDYLTEPNFKPAGIVSSTEFMGENFRIRDFTAERRKAAEDGYLWMKSQQ